MRVLIEHSFSWGNGGYATADLADFCSRHKHPLVSRVGPIWSGSLRLLPPALLDKWAAHRLKGRRLDSPQQAVGWVRPNRPPHAKTGMVQKRGLTSEPTLDYDPENGFRPGACPRF